MQIHMVVYGGLHCILLATTNLFCPWPESTPPNAICNMYPIQKQLIAVKKVRVQVKQS